MNAENKNLSKLFGVILAAIVVGGLLLFGVVSWVQSQNEAAQKQAEFEKSMKDYRDESNRDSVRNEKLIHDAEELLKAK